MPITRRRVLISGLSIGGAAALGIGCADSGDDGSGGGLLDSGSPEGTTPTEPTDDPTATEWIIPPTLLVEGSGGTVDLATTLPIGTPAGGTFGMDPSGAALPAGMTLSGDGILSVGTAAAGTIDGVVFTYETA
ncbi:MAG: hypothetical protein ABMB14_29065 [Myxococcota bacterium]